MQLLVVTKEFLIQYNKSVEEGYDDSSLVDYSHIKPVRKDYKTFEEYWSELVDYLNRKFKYTYGSKKKIKVENDNAES